MAGPWRSDKVRRPREEVQLFIDALSEVEEVEETPWRTYICGSWRRGAPTIGDLDILVVTDSGHFDDYPFPKQFKAEHQGPQIAQGDLIVMVTGEGTLTTEAMHADFFACTRAQRGAMLMFLTGPKALNINQRALAQKRGYTLSQYGLFDQDGNQLDDGTETHIYNLLHIPWLKPADRQQYAAKEVEPEPTRTFEAPSDSDPTKKYKVTLSPDYCGCLAFKYNREEPPTCKHIKRARAGQLKEVHDGPDSDADQRPAHSASRPADEAQRSGGTSS